MADKPTWGAFVPQAREFVKKWGEEFDEFVEADRRAERACEECERLKKERDRYLMRWIGKNSDVRRGVSVAYMSGAF